ncbi:MULTISPECIES: chemotaxis protein [Pseudoalteromonas]|jgi:hypothetical protein|uniref:chemotaxis protein n=1 Tax=Pseudoalteromonas sp. MT33b TaxID=2759705 RepID=UPI0015FA4939|nr:chemotaxis protein [Pseudoalteromonas sp. MT33b]QMW16851.1 chemotaxis protein [Pseudoalteromonas sp. MT33b]
MSFLSLFIQDPLTAIFSACIVFLFLYVAVSEVLKSNNYINNQNSKLEELRGLVNSKSFDNGSWLKNCFVHDNGKLLERNNLLVTNVPLNHIAGDLYDSSNKTIPALLTSIGVAGTFLGITLGLSEFDLGNVGNDSTALLHSAAVLLTGMKTAFATSLAGLVTSAFMIVILKWRISSTNIARKNVAHFLSKNCLEATPLDVLHEIASNTNTGEQVDLSSAFNKLNENMSKQLTQFEQLAESFNGNIISEKISSAVNNSLVENIVPVFNDLTTELKALKTDNELNHKQLVESLVNEMETKLIKPVTEQLSDTANTVKHSNEINQQLNTNVEKTLAEVANTVSTIDTFNQNTMEKLQQFALSLKDVLSSFKSETQVAMTEITTQVDSILSLALKGMQEQRIAFDSSTEKAGNAFEKMGENLEASLDSRAEKEAKLYLEVENRLGALLDKTNASFEEQTKVISQTVESASLLMNNAREQLQIGLGDIDTKVLNMSRAVQSELETFRAQYQENLNDFFNQQNNLLEDTLGKQRNNLIEVVDRFKGVFEQEYQTRHNLLQELTAQYQHLQSSVVTIERLVKAIGLTESSTFSQLEDIARNTGIQVGELKKQYTEASAVFKEITEGLPKAMHQYYEQANQSTELYFKGFDEAASKIHNRLAQAADFLIEAKALEKSVVESEA